MSYMKELSAQIGEMLTEGYDCVTVSNRLNVPLVWVEDVHDSLFESAEEGFDDSMDGDFDSGMASAGFGTDEDYGYYGGE